MNKNNDNKEIITITGIPIPHHYFKNSLSRDYYINNTYFIKNDINEFYEFYNKFNLYYKDKKIQIKKNQNVIFLNDVPVDIEIKDKNGEIKNKLCTLKEIKFSFVRSLNKENILTINITVD
ncbi:hypothetical protein [Caloramator sp. ALD01]|uniref:hypothetical protein n=1 Tax=Caloramator sp. ALD01 TaxID=1031288 RepID=UPI000413F402|nr:hypothetical protein [Caloramator sp. ALD01]